jgi:hypothetical protein
VEAVVSGNSFIHLFFQTVLNIIPTIDPIIKHAGMLTYQYSNNISQREIEIRRNLSDDVKEKIAANTPTTKPIANRIRFTNNSEECSNSVQSFSVRFLIMIAHL